MAHHGLAPEGMAHTFARTPGPDGNPPTQHPFPAQGVPVSWQVPTGDTPDQNGYGEG